MLMTFYPSISTCLIKISGFQNFLIKFPIFPGRGNAGDPELNISDGLRPGHGQCGRLRTGAVTDRVVGEIVI